MARAQKEERAVRLEYHSQQFAKKLFARHPEWRRYASHYEGVEEGLPVCYLDVHVPSANPRVARPLRICTGANQDVTVIWAGDWHMHFDPRPPGNTRPNYMERALTAIDMLVSDRLVIGAVYHAGCVTSAWVSEVSSDLPQWLSHELGNHVEMRSWLGTHDRDIDL